MFDLANLNGVNGFILNDETAGNQAGFSVSTAGDINGDGISDLIIGALYSGAGLGGASYVVFGQVGIGTAGILNLASLNGANGFKLNDENNIYLGVRNRGF